MGNKNGTKSPLPESRLLVGGQILTVVCAYGLKRRLAYPPFLESLEGVVLLLLNPLSSWVTTMLMLAATVSPGGRGRKQWPPWPEPERCSVAELLYSSWIVYNEHHVQAQRCPHMHLAPGQLRPQFDDRLCSHVRHSGEEAGRVLCLHCWGGRLRLCPKGGWCLSWRQHPHPLVETSGEECCKAEGVLLAFLACGLGLGSWGSRQAKR